MLRLLRYLLHLTIYHQIEWECIPATYVITMCSATDIPCGSTANPPEKKLNPGAPEIYYRNLRYSKIYRDSRYFLFLLVVIVEVNSAVSTGKAIKQELIWTYVVRSRVIWEYRFLLIETHDTNENPESSRRGQLV